MKDMQRDLQAALLGGAPTGSWGAVRSGRLLLRVVRDFAFSIVLARGIKVEQRSELVTGKGRVPYLTVLYEPVTPAALSPRAAFGVLAIAGAVLASMAPNAGAGHTWRQDGDLHPIDARWFMDWLGDRARTWLCSSAHHWDHPVGAAFGAATSTSSAVATTRSCAAPECSRAPLRHDDHSHAGKGDFGARRPGPRAGWRGDCDAARSGAAGIGLSLAVLGSLGQGLAPSLLSEQHRFHEVWHGPVLLFGSLLYEAEDFRLESQGERIALDF